MRACSTSPPPSGAGSASVVATMLPASRCFAKNRVSPQPPPVRAGARAQAAQDAPVAVEDGAVAVAERARLAFGRRAGVRPGGVLHCSDRGFGWSPPASSVSDRAPIITRNRRQ